MKTKEIEYDGVKYIIRELTFEDGFDDSTPEEKLTKDRADSAAEFILKCVVEPKLTVEEIKKLPLQLGKILLTTVNEMNGFDKQGF